MYNIIKFFSIVITLGFPVVMAIVSESLLPLTLYVYGFFAFILSSQMYYEHRLNEKKEEKLKQLDKELEENLKGSLMELKTLLEKELLKETERSGIDKFMSTGKRGPGRPLGYKPKKKKKLLKIPVVEE